MKIDLSTVVGTFECPKCKAKVGISFTEIVIVGNPICSACGNEMELSSEEGGNL